MIVRLSDSAALVCQAVRVRLATTALRSGGAAGTLATAFALVELQPG